MACITRVMAALMVLTACPADRAQYSSGPITLVVAFSAGTDAAKSERLVGAPQSGA